PILGMRKRAPASTEPSEACVGPETALVRERERRGRAAVDCLSPEKRGARGLPEILGVEFREIALLGGANVQTVRSRVRDARKELVALLGADPYFGEDACSRSES